MFTFFKIIQHCLRAYQMTTTTNFFPFFHKINLLDDYHNKRVNTNHDRLLLKYVQDLNIFLISMETRTMATPRGRRRRGDRLGPDVAHPHPKLFGLL